MKEADKQNFSCSLISMGSDEKIFGTVPRVDNWFLLEYRGAWSDKAFIKSNIPENVKKHLSKILDSIPNSRLQLIKRKDKSESPPKFYIAKSNELEPKLYELALSSYKDLLDLDVNKVINDESNVRDEPLFLICTNGAYDKCCGTHGVPVYLETVKRENGFMTWQTTHLGGHRFAANFLCLPHGIYYGRVRDNNVTKLIDDSRKQNIYLGNYRGRSCYVKDVQAADYFLRTNTGINSISAFRLKEVRTPDKESSFVGFLSQNEGKTYLVHIKKDRSALMNYTSCKDKEKSSVAQYKLIDYKVL